MKSAMKGGRANEKNYGIALDLFIPEDRGRFSVLTKKSVYGIIFKGDNYAKTSSQKK